MANVNKVILIGNLTRDPELRFTPSQMAVCDFSLAINHKYKAQSGEQKEEVVFVECTAWGRTAEVINQYAGKGKPLFVEGRLKLDSWEDKNGGGKRSKLKVIVENMQLLGGRGDAPAGGGAAQSYPDEGSQESRPPQRAPQRGRSAAPQGGAPGGASQQQEPPPFNEGKQFSDDDIPF